MTTAQDRADADVVDLIQWQHRQIEDQFQRLLSAPADGREDAFCELRRQLVVHETAEQLVVHPVLRGLGDDDEPIADARVAEERHAKDDLSLMEKTDVDDPAFMALAVALRGEVAEHAEHEEQTEHPRLRQRVPAERRLAMARAVQAADAAAPTHAHPHVPDRAVPNAVVGSAAAIADRVREAIEHFTS